ncbi:MAG: hypothetical protein AMXMBFR4_29300 [Candidatus Hydrogenedentota bacterium]
MTASTTPQPTRPGEAGTPPWWWTTGAVRVCLIGIVALGAYLNQGYEKGEAIYLAAFYLFGIAGSLGYLTALRRPQYVTALLTWAQVLVDFGVVAATVSFTGGSQSVFAFLFVIIILEAGVLLGLRQGFVIATFATAVMAVLVVLSPTAQTGKPNVAFGYDFSGVNAWYGFLIQALAYYLTAAISGFWNQQLYRMQQFQREILDNMNNGFLIVDLHGIVTVLNKAAERILHLDEANAIGRPVQEILRVAPGEECPVLTALRSDSDFTRYEYYGLTNGNTRKLLGLSTSRVYDWRKRMTGIIASFSDLTELERMREEIKRQDRLSVVGELAAGLAHEIRNPVAAIRGAVDELPANMANPVIASKLISIAVRESDQLNSIVSSFLDFARKPRMRRDVFDVVGLAQEIAEATARKYEHAKELRVLTQFPPFICPVSGDRSQIRQVFFNLAKNAVEAMEERGTLHIVVSSDSASVEIRFDDEGPGIDPDKVARIFEPFYTTKEYGVGMGLAICLRIVTAHDGTLRAASRNGGGASMSVRLPLVRAEE